MSPQDLQAWRKRMNLTAKAASQALGLSQHGYAAYERGWVKIPLRRRYGVSDTLLRPIPKHVALACERLEQMK